jgi:hypothetical protein
MKRINAASWILLLIFSFLFFLGQRNAWAGCNTDPPPSATALGSYEGEEWKSGTVAVPFQGTVSFTESASDTDTDPDQNNAPISDSISSYSWHFSDDNTNASGSTVNHVCNHIGTFTATVTVNDTGTSPACNDPNPIYHFRRVWRTYKRGKHGPPSKMC